MTWWAWLLFALWGPTAAIGIVLFAVISVLARVGRDPRSSAPAVVTLPTQHEVYPTALPAWEPVNSQ